MATANANERRDWMSVLAKARSSELAEAFRELSASLGHPVETVWLRAPEAGTVMVRGRAGATGAPFNLGEITVTRCALRLADGSVGHAYIPGHDREKARMAAICDALLHGAHADTVRRLVLAPLEAVHREARRRTSAKATATKVDFFTMVRGNE